MSQENVQIVRRYWELFNAGGVEAAARELESAFDPEVEFHEDAAFPDAGVHRGMDAIVAYVKQFQELMVGHEIEVEELREAEDSVVAFVHEVASGSRSTVAVELRPAFVWRFQGGAVVRVEAYLDRQKALEAVGLSE
jgi:ketosteroid isomerase-like protein